MKTIGIDIGGTSVKGIVMESVSGKPKVKVKYRLPTNAALGKTHILGVVEKVADRLLESGGIEAIGIGTAGRVNVIEGKVVYATDNLPGWQGLKLRDWTEAKYALPCRVDNDTNAALLGEWWLGAGRDYSELVMLTLGTGVGGAQMIHGRLHRGAHWNGGEWGHVVLFPGGRPCNCGRSGCIEQYLSGSALASLATEFGGTEYKSAEEVMTHYIEGKQQAVDAVRLYLDRLLLALQNIQNSFDPEAFVIGGGVANSKEAWLPDFEMRLQKCPGLQVRFAELGNLAGAIGASRLALQLID